jgi:peptidoglycan/LPS O-acetylase OafA/YrhL
MPRMTQPGSSTWATIFDGPAITPLNSETRVSRRSDRKNDKGTKKTFRADIQGLRAVAVLAVLLNHLTTKLPGGFVGVDIFFVISGYLITGLLVNESVRDGRISWLGFYKRRARRILPAALTVLLACLIAAHLVFKGARIRQSASDILWALGFSANVHMSRIGTDYFQANRAPSIVQHFWSLAVEEQFYIVWPVVILLVLSVLTRGLAQRGRLGALLLVVSAATVVSFVYAVQQTNSAPTQAYFSTFTRAWELGAGATLAVGLAFSDRLAHLFGRASGPVAFLGLAGIIISLFAVKSSPGFPAPWAALPVLATVLVLLAGAHGPGGVWTWLLTNRVAVYIGLVSYSLYLWHWPVIVVSEALVPRSAHVFYPMTLAAIVALTVFSYHYIESPFHKSPVQAERAEVANPRRSRAFLAVACAAVIAFASYAWKPEPVQPNFDVAASPTAASSTIDTTIAAPSPTLASEISAALAATSWPSVHPALDSASLLNELNGQNGTCINPPNLTDLTTCTFGPAGAAKRAVVVGDSISTSWLPAVEGALLPHGYAIRGMAMSNCPFNESKIRFAATPSESDRCNATHAQVEQLITQFRPTLLIVSDTIAGLGRLADKKSGTAGAAEWSAGLAVAIRHASIPGTRTVVLSPPPPGMDVTQCDTAGSTPANCVRTIPADWYAKKQADLAGATAAAATYVDDSLWFCSTSGYCPVFAAGLPMRSDTQHISNAWAQHVAPEVAKVLKP